MQSLLDVNALAAVLEKVRCMKPPLIVFLWSHHLFLLVEVTMELLDTHSDLDCVDLAVFVMICCDDCRYLLLVVATAKII